MKTKTHKSFKGNRRVDMIRDGAFDGRFGTRIVKSKKKEQSKNACRNFRFSDSKRSVYLY